MHEKTAGTKKAPALDYGATAPGQNGFLHPVTGLTVTGRTVARVGGEGKVGDWSLSANSGRSATSIAWSVPDWYSARLIRGGTMPYSDTPVWLQL